MNQPMNKRWEVVVSLTFDRLEEDEQVKHEGDAPVDFSDRALERVRPALNQLLQSSEFRHYHIETRPRPCFEFD